MQMKNHFFLDPKPINSDDDTDGGNENFGQEDF